MLKRSLIPVIFIALVFSSLGWAQIDKIAIYNENVGWTTVEHAADCTDIILANVTSAADISVLNDADMGTFAEANTGDGNFDLMIIFGYFPVSLYTPANADADGSLGELFLEGGDMILNTSDYIFYVTEGGGVNGDTGLKNMTDSNFDCWGTDDTTVITPDGETYTPSLAGVEFVANRPFKISQVDEDPDWEMEIAFATNGDEADPAIIRNLTYGGRVGLVFQTPNDDTVPRGEVISEMIDNYLAGNISAVEPGAKLAVTWGGIK